MSSKGKEEEGEVGVEQEKCELFLAIILIFVPYESFPQLNSALLAEFRIWFHTKAFLLSFTHSLQTNPVLNKDDILFLFIQNHLSSKNVCIL